MEILVILIILLLVFGGGGFYTGRRGSAGLGNILYVLAVIVLIVIALRLLGVGV